MKIQIGKPNFSVLIHLIEVVSISITTPQWSSLLEPSLHPLVVVFRTWDEAEQDGSKDVETSESRNEDNDDQMSKGDDLKGAPH